MTLTRPLEIVSGPEQMLAVIPVLSLNTRDPKLGPTGRQLGRLEEISHTRNPIIIFLWPKTFKLEESTPYIWTGAQIQICFCSFMLLVLVGPVAPC